MSVVECEQCGRQITEDTEDCPQCGAPLTEEQREQLKQQVAPPPRHRVYVYGKRKRQLSPEIRAVLILVLIVIILLLMCRVSQGATNLDPNAEVLGRIMSMSGYEYQVLQMPAQGTVRPLNERIAGMVADGWEPIMMSGDTTLNVMMRRALDAPAVSTLQAAAIAEPVGVESNT